MTEETANVFQGSPQQDEQWRREPDGPTGLVQAAVRLDGDLDPGALEGALREVVRRHESLRTTFARRPGIRIPFQVVAEELEPEFEASPDADPTVVLDLERRRRFDFERGPLVRARLITHSQTRHTLVLTLSALCADGASMPVLVAELAEHLAGTADGLGEPLQYADFAAWQLELSEADDDEARAAREAWSELEDAARPAIPFLRASSGRAPDPAPHQAVEFAPAVPAAALHAAWNVLLARLSGEPQPATGFLSAERRHADLDGAIGAFARPVPIAPHVDPDQPFADIAERVRAARARALELQDYPPVETPAKLTVGFTEFERHGSQAGALSITLERVITSGHDWRLWLTCARDGGAAWIHYDPSAYDAESAELLARRLKRLASAAHADERAPVATLEALDDYERGLTLKAFNHTVAPLPTASVHALFTAHAAADPARTAVIDEHGAISYGELDARANRLAHRLRAAGVGPGTAAGLCTDRSVDMVVGLLGILKAGGAYVPLHYEHPPQRLAHQLRTAGARAVVTQEALLARLPASEAEGICVDGGAAADAPDVEVTRENDAYVIFTSGSTGAPKGVAVTHGNLANYALDIARRLGADAEPQAFGLVTSISTDLGNTSVFGALASGGTLVLISPAAAADAAEFSRAVERSPVDVLKITPSHLRALLAADDPRILPRRTLVLGGERASWDVIEHTRRLSSCTIVNHYGPTETTVGCATYTVTAEAAAYEPASVPIGKPIANTSCYVLDERREPVPIGVPGTLYVGGAGVARGYAGDPGLTAERFSDDPFSPEAGGRMYDTGDVVRWLPDGNLEFLGRVDDQLKIRGYRVEPGEVEAALRSHPSAGEVAVAALPSAAVEPRLVAYFTGTADPDHLRHHLAERLPEFMLPSTLVGIETMPRTPSGKIDLRALPEPEAAAGTAAYVAPRTPTEQTVAAIWSRTLGIDRIGARDDFFELGGHSLLATQVVAQLRSELGVDLPLHSLFTCPTVELLAAEVVQLMGSSDEDETAALLAELESLSDAEAQKLIAGEGGTSP